MREAGSEREGLSASLGAEVVEGPTVPARAVRGLAIVLLVGAVAMPWVAQGLGLLVSPGVETEGVGGGEIVELRPALVRLPAGKFWMGSDEQEAGRNTDGSPRHEAEVAAFEICQTEVTQAQWKEVMGTEPFDCEYGCGEDLPAQNVTWNEAVEYLNRLTEMENALLGESKMTLCYEKVGDSWEWTDRACTGYRLPTETEWEYAARADTETAYSFGDDPKDLCRYANGADLSASIEHPDWSWSSELCDDGDGNFAEVRRHQANPWGLFDMHGNAIEWVWDWSSSEYPSGLTAQGYDGPERGESRVLRGGSFRNQLVNLRSALQLASEPTLRFVDFGFRCVRALPPEPSTP